MNPGHAQPAQPRVLPRSSLQTLIDLLIAQGYRVMGPTVRDGTIVWDTVRLVQDLPIGWQDRQSPGRYRLEQSEDEAVFGVVHGPQSVKPLAFAPREPLIHIERQHEMMQVSEVPIAAEKVALLGVRPCDLAGLAVQDHIFLNGPWVDPYYKARREALFLIAVNCTRAVETCFCASQQTGPRATMGYDVVLTEVGERFVLETGSEGGEQLTRALDLSAATEDLVHELEARVDGCARSQARRLDSSNLPQALYDVHEHPRWDEVASRCLSCGNCTMVCPTCFCHKVEEVPELTGRSSSHARSWDSCFTQDHGYIHGKNVRPMTKDRYRMWLTHKVASWIDQFGMSGCVGCGRCITWCPVGIDLTEEVPILLAERQP